MSRQSATEFANHGKGARNPFCDARLTKRQQHHAMERDAMTYRHLSEVEVLRDDESIIGEGKLGYRLVRRLLVGFGRVAHVVPGVSQRLNDASRTAFVGDKAQAIQRR